MKSTIVIYCLNTSGITNIIHKIHASTIFFILYIFFLCFHVENSYVFGQTGLLISNPFYLHASNVVSNDISTSLSYTPKPKRPTLEIELREALLKKQDDNITKFISLWNVSTNTGSSSRSVVNNLLQLCSDLNRYEYASKVIESLDSKYFTGITDYEIIPFLQNCKKTRNSIVASKLVETIQSKGVFISAKTYAILIQGYGNAKNEIAIDSILEQCVENRLQLDLILLHNAMDSYIKCNNIGKSLSLFQIIHSNSDFTKIKSTMTSLKLSYAIYNQLKLSCRKIQPNTRTFNIVLKALRELIKLQSESSVLEIGYHLLDDMKNLRLYPDSVTINTIIDIAVVERKFSEAEKLIRSNDIAEPTVEAFTSIISGYAGDGDINSAYCILDLMLERGISPNVYTITSLITAGMNAKDPRKSKSILENPAFSSHLLSSEKSIVHGAYIGGLCSLATSFHRFNNGTINDSIKDNIRGNIYDNQNEEDVMERLSYLFQAKLHILEMDYLGISPDITTMNALMKAVATLLPNGIHVALEIYKAMLSDYIYPDEYSISILLTALGREGYINEALKVYESAVNTGLLDSVSINSLLKACADGTKPLQSILLFLQLSESILPNSSRKRFDQSKLNPFKMIKFDSSSCSTAPIVDYVPDQVTFTILFSSMMRSGNSNTNLNVNSYNPFQSSLISPYSLSPSSLKKVYSTVLSDKVHIIKSNSTSNIGSYMRRYLIEGYRSGILSSQPESNNRQRSPLVLTPNNMENLKILENYGPNVILNGLYRLMRFVYNIEPDVKMISTLKSLFYTYQYQNKGITKDMYGDWNENIIPNEYWLENRGFDEQTARLIFEDLVISGCHPKEIITILKACKYSTRKENQLLNDDKLLAELRSSSASVRIFQKHGWNSMDSRWSPF